MTKSTDCVYTYRFFSYNLKNKLKYNIENIFANFDEFNLHTELFFRSKKYGVREFSFYKRSRRSVYFSDFQNKFLNKFLDNYIATRWLIAEGISLTNKIAMNIKTDSILDMDVEDE